MTNKELMEFAEMHAYQHRRCHACGAHWWTDTQEDCPQCGGARGNQDEEEQTK